MSIDFELYFIVPFNNKETIYFSKNIFFEKTRLINYSNKFHGFFRKKNSRFTGFDLFIFQNCKNYLSILSSCTIKKKFIEIKIREKSIINVKSCLKEDRKNQKKKKKMASSFE